MSHDHPLAVFAGDPSLCVNIGADCWEVVNPMMKAAFGWALDRADGKTWEGKIQ